MRESNGVLLLVTAKARMLLGNVWPRYVKLPSCFLFYALCVWYCSASVSFI